MDKKNGFSLISMMFFIFLMGVIGIYGFKIGSGYLDQQTIKGAVKEALSSAKSNDNASTKSIRSSIMRRISINNIELKDDQISITKNGTDFEVEIDYIKEVELTENIKLVMDLTILESTPK